MNASRLVRLHADLLMRAARSEAIARRLAYSDPDRASCETVDAAEARATAADLADALVAAGVEVLRASDPRQLVLLSDGVAA